MLVTSLICWYLSIKSSVSFGQLYWSKMTSKFCSCFLKKHGLKKTLLFLKCGTTSPFPIRLYGKLYKKLIDVWYFFKKKTSGCATIVVCLTKHKACTLIYVVHINCLKRFWRLFSWPEFVYGLIFVFEKPQIFWMSLLPFLDGHHVLFFVYVICGLYDQFTLVSARHLLWGIYTHPLILVDN